MNRIFTLLFSLLFSLSAFAQIRFIEVENIEDYQAVINTVQQRDKMMFVALHDDGGEFRKMFFDGVFSDPALVKASQNYTCLAIDLNEEMGARYTSIFELTEAPTFFLMNSEELVLKRLSGYITAADLSKNLKTTFQQKGEYDSLLVKYNKYQLSDSEWARLLEIYSLNFDFNKTSQLALEFLNTKSGSQLFAKPVAQVLASYGVDFETTYPMLVYKNQSSLKSSLGDFDFSNFFQACYSYNLDLAIENKDSVLLQKFVKEFVALDPAGKNSAIELSFGTYNIYGLETGHFETWKQGILQYGKLLQPADSAAEFIFEAAYNLVEANNSDPALVAAHEAAKLSNQRLASFKSRMLVAYTSYLLEDFTAAKDQISDAVKMAKSADELRNATKLQGLVEEELNKTEEN
tara:strand:- start:7551 stop:8765 length:1215 start_codon:yes stop_codon:yes gene_type:complete